MLLMPMSVGMFEPCKFFLFQLQSQSLPVNVTRSNLINSNMLLLFSFFRLFVPCGLREVGLYDNTY